MELKDIKGKQEELGYNISDEIRQEKFDISNTNRSSKTVDKDEMSDNYNKTLGIIEIPLVNLPTKGIFYNADMRLYIRPAQTAEIKDYSLMDETNPLDINDKINNIISSCVELKGAKLYSYKELVEDDKMFIALSVRELTFPKGESVIKMRPMCPHCEHENEFELRTENLQYYNENADLSKYFSREDKCYNVRTKDFGVIKLSSPRVGVMQQITEYAKNKQANRQKWDKAYIQILPYLILDWKGLNEKTITETLIGMQSWTPAKFSLLFRLIEMMRNGIKQTLSYNCVKCGHDLDVNVEIEGGMRTLFVPNNTLEQLI